MSDQSLTGLSDRSAAAAAVGRPGGAAPFVGGTLTAADAGALGGVANYQLPGRSPAAGIINFKSNGIFNLPRYYPSYQRFDDNKTGDDDDDIRSTWRSGDDWRAYCVKLKRN